ncbi:MAG TPA: AAA family ATPase, partial [Candidatus Xenobia bacterium]
MRLHELSVQNWRGLAARTIAFHPGLTVVQGHNESGKSTLREALRMVLLDKFTPARAKPIVPWDRKVEPEVTLTFDIGGDRYRVKKVFLRKRDAAELYRNDRLVAQDAAVQGELERILGDEAQWIPTLWGTQGVVELRQEIPATMRGRLISASQETAAPGVTWLAERLEEGYSFYWTEKKGDPNSRLKNVRSATLRAEAALGDARVALRAADERVAELAADTQKIDEWRQQIRQAEQSQEAAAALLKQWEAWRQASAAVERKREQHEHLVRWLKSWQEAAARLEAARQATANYEEQLRVAAP